MNSRNTQSDRTQQIDMRIIYIHCFNTTCPPCHQHNGFMTTGALGYTQVRLHFVVIQESERVLEL